jgi:hypothetical protein
MPSWAARAAALARGAGHPDALSEGAIPSLPLELRSLCKGAWHRCASGGAVPLLPHEMRRCELKNVVCGHARVKQVAEQSGGTTCSETIRVKETVGVHRGATGVQHWRVDRMSSHRSECGQRAEMHSAAKIEERNSSVPYTR